MRTKNIDLEVWSWKLESVSCTNRADSTNWAESFHNLQIYLRIFNQLIQLATSKDYAFRNISKSCHLNIDNQVQGSGSWKLTVENGFSHEFGQASQEFLRSSIHEFESGGSVTGLIHTSSALFHHVTMLVAGCPQIQCYFIFISFFLFSLHLIIFCT